MRKILLSIIMCIGSLGMMAQDVIIPADDVIDLDSLIMQSLLADSLYRDSIGEPVIPMSVRSYNLKIERTIEDDVEVLTPNGWDEHYLWPQLSPDRTKIVYYLTRKGTYVCDIDGNDPRFIAADLYAPQWLDNNTVMGYCQMIKGRSMMAYDLNGRSIGYSDKLLSSRYRIPRINQYVDHHLAKYAHPKVYINPGHGSWTNMDRPMQTLSHPNVPGTVLPDTCGFYESNTDMWVCMELGGRLRDAGYEVMYSRTGCGPYPTTGTFADKYYNLPLAVIAAEADSWEADMFISVHSNSAKEGGLTNYPLMLYRGNNGSPFVTGCHEMAATVWPYLTECMRSGLEWQSDYTDRPCIRGDLNFYNSSSLGPTGQRGYLGVMKHERPGFLVETYFHTYQPARHRALNPDYCAQEGISLARGIKAYFGTPADTEGHIMGVVKDNTQTMKGYRLFNYAPGTHDAYKPCMGARVILYDENHNALGDYITDNNWNGLFAFWDLKPGKYYLAIRCEGYLDSPSRENEVIVSANKTTYPIIYLKPDIPEPEPEPEPEPAVQETPVTPTTTQQKETPVLDPDNGTEMEDIQLILEDEK